MDIFSPSSLLATIQSELASYESVSFENIRNEKFSISTDISDFSSLYEVITDCEHRGYLALWLLGGKEIHAQWAFNLTELDMSLMDLTELPTNIKYLQNVEHLNLEFNPLERKNRYALEALPNLKTFSLSTGQRSLVPESLLLKSRYVHICQIMMKMDFCLKTSNSLQKKFKKPKNYGSKEMKHLNKEP